MGNCNLAKSSREGPAVWMIPYEAPVIDLVFCVIPVCTQRVAVVEARLHSRDIR